MTLLIEASTNTDQFHEDPINLLRLNALTFHWVISAEIDPSDLSDQSDHNDNSDQSAYCDCFNHGEFFDNGDNKD